MCLVCSLIFQPIITLIQIVVSFFEKILVVVCKWVEELVEVVKQIPKWICTNVVHTVCSTACSTICGLFCGIFGCSCDKVCKTICNTVTDVVCGWTYIFETVLEYATRLVCTYLLQLVLVTLHLVLAFVTMVLTWVCSLVDVGLRWLFCWTYVSELPDLILGSRRPRRFRVAPKIVRNAAGYSDWFVYVNNADATGAVDQNARIYVLSDAGRPLLPVAVGGGIAYFEVETRGATITGNLRLERGEPVRGRPFLYYPYKIMEIASHLFGDIFASASGDDGTGTEFPKNLFTYQPNVQAWLAAAHELAENNYNTWPSKLTNSADQDFFGDGSIADMGTRVDTDDTCSRPTNTFLHLTNGAIGFTPTNSSVAENMSCGPGQTLSFNDTNFLMLNKDGGMSITTYFVSSYEKNENQVGCNDLLGYTIVTFGGASGPLFVTDRVLEFDPDTNLMMSRIVRNVSGNRPQVVRVAETYLHECSHQSGLLHDDDLPECEDDATLHITKVMAPSGHVRRAYTRIQWCMMRGTCYITGSNLPPFTQTSELPDSGSVPKPHQPASPGGSNP